MKSSPIYSRVSIEGRSDRDFGAGPLGFEQSIQVGTSRTNSHNLADIAVRRITLDDGRQAFYLYLDGKVVKCGILDGQEYTAVKV